LTDRCVHRM